MNFRRATCTFVATVAFPTLAIADPIPIASIPIDIGLGISPQFPLSRGRFALTVSGRVHLFDNVVISEATAGQTLTASASNSVQFSEFARLTTNGVANTIHYDFGPVGTTGGGSVGANSEAALFRLPFPGVDFHGFSLDRVELRVDQFPLSAIDGTTFRFLCAASCLSSASAPSRTRRPSRVACSYCQLPGLRGQCAGA